MMYLKLHESNSLGMLCFWQVFRGPPKENAGQGQPTEYDVLLTKPVSSCVYLFAHRNMKFRYDFLNILLYFLIRNK